MAKPTPATGGIATFSPWGFAAMSLASGLMAEADKNELRAQKAKDFGIRKAGIESANSTRIQTLITQSAQIQESQALSEQVINKSQAQAQADAEVQAAAAGVEGVSVNQVVTETAINAENAKAIVKTNAAHAQNQLRLNFVDNALNTDTATGTLNTSTTNPDLGLTLDFVQGFQQGFVPTSKLEGND